MSGVYCVVCTYEIYVSKSNPWLTVQSALSSITGLGVCRERARRDSVCFEEEGEDEIASLTSL